MILLHFVLFCFSKVLLLMYGVLFMQALEEAAANGNTTPNTTPPPHQPATAPETRSPPHQTETAPETRPPPHQPATAPETRPPPHQPSATLYSRRRRASANADDTTTTPLPRQPASAPGVVEQQQPEVQPAGSTAREFNEGLALDFFELGPPINPQSLNPTISGCNSNQPASGSTHSTANTVVRSIRCKNLVTEPSGN